MDISSLQTGLSIYDEEANALSGSIENYGDRVIIFRPVLMRYETTYTVTVSGQVQDQSGARVGQDVSWEFTTGTEADEDHTFPEVIDRERKQDVIYIYFSEDIDPLSLVEGVVRFQRVIAEETLEEERINKHGVRAIVEKPIDVQRLMEAIGEVLH